jgi:hypothetical protein
MDIWLNAVRASQAVAGFVGAYDDIPNITAAYSTRRLLTAYTGNLLRIRRSSDNVEQDFGYDDDGHLDTAAVATFIGGGSGLIVTWYDQGGGGYNATQATAAAQPLYVASGQNGRPVVRGDSVDDFLSNSAMPWSGDPQLSVLSISYERAAGTFTGTNPVWCVGDRAGTDNRSVASFCYEAESSDAVRLFGGNTVFPNSIVQNWYLHVHRYAGGGVAFEAWRNATSLTPTSSSPGALDLNNGIAIFYALGASATWVFAGSIAELVIANAAWSTADREAAETAANNYWGVY